MPTALISVYDKVGLIPLAEGLLAQGWRILEIDAPREGFDL